MRRYELKIVLFLFAIFVSGIVGAIVYQAALNNSYDPQHAFLFGLGTFGFFILVFNGLIRASLRR